MEKLLYEIKSCSARAEGWALALLVLIFIFISSCNKSSESPGDALRPANFTDKQWLGKQLFFDTYFRTGMGLTIQETLGLSLFNGKAKCANCHTSTAYPASGRVLFTDFTFLNIGVPKNLKNPFYSELDQEPAGPHLNIRQP